MAHPRSGAALIMAIVILAALLMLGLPFLFSQSASLSGTRSFAHSQQAQTGRTTAEELGIGEAALMFNRTLTQGMTGEHTDINDIGAGIIPNSEPRRRTLDMTPRAHAFNPAEPRNTALIGVSLEDESGKLDPNYMSTNAWVELLRVVGIPDWDDGNGNTKDIDEDGQLAYALASVRYDEAICPTGRITRLEQLLEARPLPEGVRHHLTRAELEQLRPYLTLAPMGQGREGLVDLGTMIRRINPQEASNWEDSLDSGHPLDLVAYTVTPALVGAGSVIVSNHPTKPLTPVQLQRGRKYHYGMSTSMDFATIPTGNRPANPQNVPRPSGYYPSSHAPVHEEQVALEIAAPVNLTESSQPVRAALFNVTRMTATQWEQLMQVPALQPDAFGRAVTGFNLVNPLGVYDFIDEDSNATLQPTTRFDPNHGLSGDPPTNPTNILTASATLIHITGGALDRLPRRGFARIEPRSNSTGTGTGTGTGGSTTTMGVEFVSYGSFGYNGSNGTLMQVTRGLDFPGTSGALDHPTAGSKITFIAPHELPPLSLASQGMVTIESGASVADAAGRQGAQQMRRVVAQAVPQEHLLEMRWEKQTQYHALLAQRHGSLVNAFPKGYQRVYNELPDYSTNPRASGTKDDNIGVKPATLRTHITSSHLGTGRDNGHEWSRRFGMEGTGAGDRDVMAQGDDEQAPTGGATYDQDDLSPEGLKLTNGPIAYGAFTTIVNNTTRGFFTSPAIATTASAATLNGRQFGMWVKPTQQLSGTVTLLDLRSPTDRAGPRFALPNLIDAATGMQARFPAYPERTGDNYYQNRVTLAYEDASKQLVLTICNGTIEHTEDHGPICHGELYQYPNGDVPIPPMVAGPYIDPRCLGSIAPPTGNVVTTGINALAPKRRFNLVQHRYQLSRTDGLKADQWHLIQVAMVGNDPGHMSITVNGVAGRDVTRLVNPTDALRMQDLGDHLTLPVLVLGNTTLPPATGAQSTTARIIQPTIELKALAFDPTTGQMVTGAGAVDLLLPQRGMIRIGNEYISYESRQGAVLRDCLRGRRQDTHVGSDRPDYNWLVLEEHRPGDLVVPGGIRYNPGSDGHLWKGGCTLAHPLPNGDPMRGYTVWTELATPMTVDMISGLPAILDTDTSGVIRLNAGSGLIADWPPRGFATFGNGEIIYYDNGGAKPTDRLNGVQRGQLGTMPATLLFPANTVRRITLISFEGVPVGSGDAASNYANTTVPAPGMPWIFTEPQMVQISDPLTGRIEWIRYTHIDTTKGAPLFVDFDAFSFDPLQRVLGSRARQRTAFAATDIKDGEMMTFPAGSGIIPVQTSLDHSHVLATGDVMTITPKNPLTHRPWQACVRYAATDGFHPMGATPPMNNTWDTVNRYFAFSEPLPENWDDGTFELIGWPGWSGNDIGPGGPAIRASDNLRLPYFTMPLASAFGPNAEVYIGGDNTRLPFTGHAGNQRFNGVIDGLWSGVQPGGNGPPTNNNPRDHLVVRLMSTPGNLTGTQQWLDDKPKLDKSVIIRTSDDIFHQEVGLVRIGGEVFAYERWINAGNEQLRTARLIGRGLLGSKPLIHRGPEPIMVLPIGPVGRLANPLTTNRSAEQELFITLQANRIRDLTGRFSGVNKVVMNAPAMLLCSPDGTRMEVIGATNRCVAPWFRGMYNTAVATRDWPSAGQQTPAGSPSGAPSSDLVPDLDTLVIGWWPRYPSGMPNPQSTAWTGLTKNEHKSALLRCRLYAWMGFPIRYHDTWMTGGGLADVEVLDDGLGTFNVVATALEQGFDWNEANASSVTLRAGGGSQDASAIFTRFQRKAVDGVEMRLRWEYRLPAADGNNLVQTGTTSAAAAFLDRLATAGNTAPMIGKVRLRARAPAKILQVEDAR